ncbi:hypothetical protein PIIN_11347 [Serendipita indica DSM 11827]|uniref:Uncharacterized protein n=1 Tax=Serendipita indica (strain DSM 11827) TaxID=1109443 RepID=G4U1C7_SERID|nr:hypothetical protein PIIN_11347 [Serendipita indica DSM 11827]
MVVLVGNWVSTFYVTVIAFKMVTTRGEDKRSVR